MSIDWAAFLIVLVSTLVAACGIVTLYSLGLRLLDDSRSWSRRAGIACFVVCGLAILYGIYLVVPVFHR